jgi:hypothetical protein
MHMNTDQNFERVHLNPCQLIFDGVISSNVLGDSIIKIEKVADLIAMVHNQQQQLCSSGFLSMSQR